MMCGSPIFGDVSCVGFFLCEYSEVFEVKIKGFTYMVG